MNRRTVLVLAISLMLAPILSGCTSTPHRVSAGAFLDSSLITARIKTRLINDRITGGFFIKVFTYKGTVQLSGFVNSDYEKRYAADLAQSVSGVRQVKNMLIVRADQK